MAGERSDKAEFNKLIRFFQGKLKSYRPALTASSITCDFLPHIFIGLFQKQISITSPAISEKKESKGRGGCKPGDWSHGHHQDAAVLLGSRPLRSLTSGLAATEKSGQEDEESPPENEFIYPPALQGG